MDREIEKIVEDLKPIVGRNMEIVLDLILHLHAKTVDRDKRIEAVEKQVTKETESE